VSGNIPEIFITRQREKATRGIDLDTQHDLLETNRAGPKFRELGPTRQENWNFQARPGPRAARPVLSSSTAVDELHLRKMKRQCILGHYLDRSATA
jgi:hypothetical protein